MTDEPNAFAFKLKIDGEYTTCICPRIDDAWRESEIFHVDSNMKNLEDVLDDIQFSVVFLYLNPTDDGTSFEISSKNGAFLKSNHVASELYETGKFFEFVESGYQKYYFDDVSNVDTETEFGDG